MGYKRRHPSSHIWLSKNLDSMQPPAHYGLLAQIGMLEAIAPDGTEFLAISGPLDENESYSWFYMIEAPKTCPMRQLFEAGKMSWIDFWSHKGWLLTMKVPFCHDGDTVATYCTIQDLPSEEVTSLKDLGMVSPYDLKYRGLANWVEREIKWRKMGGMDNDLETSEKAYIEFVTKYAQRIPSLKAAA